MTTKVRSCVAARGVRLALGELEGEEHALADLERVFDRLEARRRRAPTSSWPKYDVSRPAREDEEVVAQRRAVGEVDAPLRGVDAGGLAP